MKDYFEGELKGRYTVRSIDTDYGRHMNNVAYIKAVEGLFSSKELDELKISELEIHYKNPCFEGETITFYIKKEEDFMKIKIVKEDGSTSALVRIR